MIQSPGRRVRIIDVHAYDAFYWQKENFIGATGHFAHGESTVDDERINILDEGEWLGGKFYFDEPTFYFYSQENHTPNNHPLDTFFFAVKVEEIDG